MIFLIAVGAGLAISAWQIKRWTRRPPAVVATPTLSYGAFLASRAPSGEPMLEIDLARVPYPISLRRGQTLGDVLVEQGLDPAEVHALVTSLEGHLEVRQLHPGEIGLAYFDAGAATPPQRGANATPPQRGANATPPHRGANATANAILPQREADARLASLRLAVGREGWVELVRDGTGWASSRHQFARNVEIQRIEGVLDSLLIDDIIQAGGRQHVAYAMSNVLQWDLDFNRDLRKGDRFQVLYEEVYLDGEFAGLGEIQALVYENRGRRFEAYRFGESGYYDATGRPLQKMFLRSPLPFTRVTSRFSHRRFHPILKVHRPHYGVDYGAPRGTKVRVTAGGTVMFAGVSGGAGKMVKVRHPNGYQTSYLHLSRFGKGVRRGKTVAQGDIIGYVGSTGLSTAPHLDYRVKKNGRWLDPMRLKSDPVEPIPEHQMARFLARRDVFVAALANGRLPDAAWVTSVVAEGHTRGVRGEAAGR